MTTMVCVEGEVGAGTSPKEHEGRRSCVEKIADAGRTIYGDYASTCACCYGATQSDAEPYAEPEPDA